MITIASGARLRSVSQFFGGMPIGCRNGVLIRPLRWKIIPDHGDDDPAHDHWDEV